MHLIHETTREIRLRAIEAPVATLPWPESVRPPLRSAASVQQPWEFPI